MHDAAGEKLLLADERAPGAEVRRGSAAQRAAEKLRRRGCHCLWITALGACVLVLVSRMGVTAGIDELPYPPPGVPPEERVRGVSLGGWLLLEPFITPGLFDRANALLEARYSRSAAERPRGCERIIDQWSLHACLGHNASLQLVAPHWSSFVQRDDLRTLRDAGINVIRVPVPYWLVDIDADAGEPWCGLSEMQLAFRRVLGWAVELGLKVFVDLHGAPGSQNGFDNSGQHGATRWQASGEGGLPNVARTLVVWRRLARLLREFAASADVEVSDVLAGLEVINEAPCFEDEIDRDVLRAFLVDVYFQLRADLGSEIVPIYLHDCFFPHDWSDFMRGPRFRNVLLDRHEYQVFDVGQQRWPREEHLRLTCEQGFSVAQDQASHGTIVGEFSVAVNDCDRYLNGWGQGSRFEGTPPFSNERVGSCDPYRNASLFTPEYKRFLLEYAELQMMSWDRGVGWIFWNFKTEGGSAPHFDYLLGLKHGYLPPVAGEYSSSCPASMRRTMV